jgi:hypothetical protein
MLVVSSSVWMLYWILCHTSDLWPIVTLNSILVVCISSLEEWFIGTSTSCYNTNLSTAYRGYSLLTSRRKTKTGGSLFFVVGNNHSETSGPTSKGSTVSRSSLNIAHNGSFWHRGQRKTVSNGKSCLLSAVNELSSVHTLGSNHEFIVTFETVSVHELNLADWCSTTWVMEDFLNDSLNVSVLFSIVEGSEFDGSLACAGVSLENGGFTLPLCLSISMMNQKVVSIEKCIIPLCCF